VCDQDDVEPPHDIDGHRMRRESNPSRDLETRPDRTATPAECLVTAEVSLLGPLAGERRRPLQQLE
jgi:hypothetical protein